MQQTIPDDLVEELKNIAVDMDCNLDEVVRVALESWLKRVRQASKRLPDSALTDDMITAPIDLPRSHAHVISAIQGAPHLPDGVGLH